jgi:hypothetical protein
VTRKGFPRGGPEDTLFTHFTDLGSGLPLAVVDGDGRLTGIVEPSEALRRLQANEDEKEAA